LTHAARQQFLAFLLKFGLPLKDDLAWDWGACLVIWLMFANYWVWALI
jgi:hypothetical protein